MENYLGDIRLFAGDFAIEGWALCNGQLLSIAENEALYSLIGTTYGGDGATTFAVPDLRGRAPVHQGQGPGLSAYALGQAGGSETVTLQTSQYPAHGHALAAGTAAGDAAPSGGVLAGNTVPVYGNGGPTVTMASQGVGAAPGGGQPHDNMAPFQVVNYLIALVGYYPTAS